MNVDLKFGENQYLVSILSEFDKLIANTERRNV